MHGGPDRFGVPRWDFSTNANANGPAPMVLRAVQRADPMRYPDPHYHALRHVLADFHAVSPERIVIAASASEFIMRMTGAIARNMPRGLVFAPTPGYDDYLRAAMAHGLGRAEHPQEAALVWHADPGSPHGRSADAPELRSDAVIVIDAVYSPLRLEGVASQAPRTAWRLMSPNKALGLAGIRAAYAIAPPDQRALCDRLNLLAPSWPLGAHGVELLAAWSEPATQQWLEESLHRLRAWKHRQVAMQQEFGWRCESSVVPFYIARCPGNDDSLARLLPALRGHGIKLRDTTSFGLPGQVRISVQTPSAQDAFAAAWQKVMPR